MLIERIWSGNAYRNFHYLIACPETRRGARRGPAGVAACLDAAREPRLADHADPQHARASRPHRRQRRARRRHARQGAGARGRGQPHRRRGSRARRRATSSGSGAPSSSNAWTRRATRWRTSACSAHARSAGSVLRRHSVQCRRGQLPRRRAPGALYETFATQLARLPDDTRVYPGHEYLARNLEFTLDREPGNADAQQLLARGAERCAGERGRHDARGGEAREHLLPPAEPRQSSQRLREAFPDIGEQPDARTVFVKLRELRNRW